MLNRIRIFWYFFLRHGWVRHGKNVHVQLGCFFGGAEPDITIGDRVGIGFSCFFLSKCQIGSDILIASNCHFVNRFDHRYNVVGKTMWDSGRGAAGKIIVEDDVWIGESATILAPLVIGRGSIVAAGAIVTCDVPPYSIVAGNPARVIKMRFSAAEIVEHQARLLTLKR
jgi:acetyltransferase-like isoleucine patch superfamily enzyme